MKIKVDQNKLRKALGIVSRVAAGSKTTLPILNNVLIKSEKNKVTFTTTNLDMAVVYYLPTTDSEDGVITVPARLLADFVSNLPKGQVEINTKDTKVTVSLGKYKSIFNGVLADDFPELPEINEKKATIFKIKIDDFKTYINEVMVASSNDLTRPALTGVYFNVFENNLYVTATDGYRLVTRKMIDGVKSDISTIVPSASLSEVLRSLDDDVEEIEILFDDSQVKFRLGEIEITSKIIEGSFPDYRQLIPKDTEVKIDLDKSELTRVVKLAALFAKEVGGSIVCEAKEDEELFTVAAVANEFGENTSEIKTKLVGNGKITLNSRYVLDALNTIEKDEIEFGFSGKLSPVVIKNKKSNNYTHIIMPLKS